MSSRTSRACPECGASAVAARDRGEVFPCTSCGAWLYLGLWDADNPERCEKCGCACSLDGECIYCDTETPRRQGLFGRLTSHLRGKRTIRMVPIDRIVSDTIQPRLGMNVLKFDALRQSIARVGIIQPLLLRRISERGEYEVVSGQRRLMAARHLGWPRIPARTLSVSDEQAHAIRLAENIHREELSPIELAESFEKYFVLEASAGREELAERVGVDIKTLDSLVAALTVRAPRKRAKA